MYADPSTNKPVTFRTMTRESLSNRPSALQVYDPVASRETFVSVSELSYTFLSVEMVIASGREMLAVVDQETVMPLPKAVQKRVTSSPW